MKVAVIGSRCFNNYSYLKAILDKISITKIISGGAKGVDTLAEKYAKEKEIQTVIFLPDWSKYGKGAGIIRNKSIVNNSDMIVAFWDGKSKGTKFSIDYAKKANKTVKVVLFV